MPQGGRVGARSLTSPATCVTVRRLGRGGGGTSAAARINAAPRPRRHIPAQAEPRGFSKRLINRMDKIVIENCGQSVTQGNVAHPAPAWATRRRSGPSRTRRRPCCVWSRWTTRCTLRLFGSGTEWWAPRMALSAVARSAVNGRMPHNARPDTRHSGQKHKK